MDLLDQSEGIAKRINTMAIGRIGINQQDPRRLLGRIQQDDEREALTDLLLAVGATAWNTCATFNNSVHMRQNGDLAGAADAFASLCENVNELAATVILIGVALGIDSAVAEYDQFLNETRED